MNGQLGIPGFHVFLELLIKSTLALSFSLLISSLLRKKSASLRHFVLAVFLIGLLIVPVLSPFHFGWETHLLPSDTWVIGQEWDAPRFGALNSWLPENHASASAAAGSSTGTESEESVVVGATARPPSAPSSALSSRTSLDISLAMIWALGLAVLVLRMGLGLTGASRMTREGEPVVDPVWRILMHRFLAAVGLKRSIRLKSHAKVIVPLTWGFIKPVILIPSGHESWSADQKSSALFHELSHIKRFDFLITLLVRLSLALFWFNPLCWLVYRRMKCEQEKACDELVLKAGIKPSTYAANLLLFRGSAGLRWASPAALLGMLGRSSFGERLAAILGQKLTFKEVTMKTKISFGAVIILAQLFIAAARPSTATLEVNSDSMIGEALVMPFPAMSEPASMVTGQEIQPAANLEAAVQEEQKKQAERAEQAEQKKRTEQEEQERQIERTEQTEQRRQTEYEEQRRQAEHEQQRQQAEYEEQRRQAEQEEQKQQEEQEQKKEKQPKKLDRHTIVISNKKGKKVPIAITVVEEGGKKTVKLDGAVTIKRGKEGEILLWDSEGSELMLVDGKPVRLVIKEGDVEVIEEENVIKLGKGSVLVWHQKGEEGEDDVDVFIVSGKDAKTVKLGKAGTHGWVVKTEEGQEEEAVHVVTGKVVVADKAQKSDKKWTHVQIQPLKIGKKVAWVPKEDQDEIKKSLAAIRESLKKLKQEEAAVREIMESLTELEEKLKKREGAFVTGYIAEESPKSYTIIRKEGKDKSLKEAYITRHDDEEKVTVFSSGEGEAHIVYSIGSEGKSREVYEKTVARVKKELPEGWSLEPEYDEESGVIKLKIKGIEGQAPSKEFILKLADIIKEEVKK